MNHRDKLIWLMSLVFVSARADTQNFKGQNLSNRSFAGQNLAGAQFESAVLDGVNFRGCNLTGANFNSASTVNQSVIFDGANLENSTFIGVKLAKVNFANARLSGIDFSKAVMGDADFSYAAMQGGKFQQATLGIGGNLIFKKTKLIKVSFESANIYGGIFSDQAILNQVDLSQANLMRTVFDNCELTGSQFKQAQLSYVVFRDSTLDQTNFSAAKLSSVNFERSKQGNFSLKNINFNEAYLKDLVGFTDLLDNQKIATGSTFIKATFENVSFANIRLIDQLDFSEATFTGPGTSFERAQINAVPKFAKARFIGREFPLKLFSSDMINYRGSIFGPSGGAIKFVETVIDGTSFTEAQFEWADLTRITILNYADFKGAYFVNSKMASADIVADFRCTKFKHCLIQYNSFEQSKVQGSGVVGGAIEDLIGDMGKTDVSQDSLDDQTRYNLLPAGAAYRGEDRSKVRQLCSSYGDS